MFERIDKEADFLPEHPDLEDESYSSNHNTWLKPGSPEFYKMYPHVGEAEREIRMLDRAITHLQKVRPTKNAAAQSTIDEYIAEAERYKQIFRGSSIHDSLSWMEVVRMRRREIRPWMR